MKGKDQETVYTRSQEQEQHQEKNKQCVSATKPAIKVPDPLFEGKEGPNKWKTVSYIYNLGPTGLPVNTRKDPDLLVRRSSRTFIRKCTECV